jgi:type II secretory pathway pseudopilin PulG
MKKRALTLLEIMIVIFLITLITGTIGYSMKGTLDRGRAFRTEQAQEQLKDLLLIAVAEGKNIDDIAKNPESYLKAMGLAKKPKTLIQDGWNEPFSIVPNQRKNDFIIHSKSLENYYTRTGIKKDKDKDEAEEN